MGGGNPSVLLAVDFLMSTVTFDFHPGSYMSKMVPPHGRFIIHPTMHPIGSSDTSDIVQHFGKNVASLHRESVHIVLKLVPTIILFVE